MNEQELVVKTSPIKLVVEKDGKEYEFESIGDVTDIVKLKTDIIDIMKRFNITVKSKDTVFIPKKAPIMRQSLDEYYLLAKELIREWYKENPEREWSANELMETAKLPKEKRNAIMTRLLKTEKFIKCVNPTSSRNTRKYLKAEAMITPEAIVEKDMKKLEEERKLVRDVMG